MKKTKILLILNAIIFTMAGFVVRTKIDRKIAIAYTAYYRTALGGFGTAYSGATVAGLQTSLGVNPAYIASSVRTYRMYYSKSTSHPLFLK